MYKLFNSLFLKNQIDFIISTVTLLELMKELKYDDLTNKLKKFEKRITERSFVKRLFYLARFQTKVKITNP